MPGLCSRSEINCYRTPAVVHARDKKEIKSLKGSIGISKIQFRVEGKMEENAKIYMTSEQIYFANFFLSPCLPLLAQLNGRKSKKRNVQLRFLRIPNRLGKQ